MQHALLTRCGEGVRARARPAPTECSAGAGERAHLQRAAERGDDVAHAAHLGDEVAAEVLGRVAQHVTERGMALVRAVLLEEVDVPDAKWAGSLVAFLLGGVAQAFVPGASATTCKRIGMVLGAWMLGFAGFVVLINLALG